MKSKSKTGTSSRPMKAASTAPPQARRRHRAAAASVAQPSKAARAAGHAPTRAAKNTTATGSAGVHKKDPQTATKSATKRMKSPSGSVSRGQTGATPPKSAKRSNASEPPQNKPQPQEPRSSPKSPQPLPETLFSLAEFTSLPPDYCAEYIQPSPERCTLCALRLEPSSRKMTSPNRFCSAHCRATFHQIMKHGVRRASMLVRAQMKLRAGRGEKVTVPELPKLRHEQQPAIPNE